MFFKKKTKETNETTIANVYKAHGKGATSLVVSTTLGKEVVRGVEKIVERGDYIIFAASTRNGGGLVVAKQHFIQAVPE